MRAATCTPVNFNADAHFFGRDSGLLSRSLQKIGVDCFSIMPGIANSDEPCDMLRVRPEQLRDSDWWKSLGLDLVVLYAWGDPKYIEIARSIRDAGIFLIQNLDSSGIESPYADVSRWWISLRDQIRGPQPASARRRLVARGLRDFFPPVYERKRLKMFATSDLLAAVSPPARANIIDYATALGFAELASKIAVIPHPVVDEMDYRGEPKANRVLCVGRWQPQDHHQKDPALTLDVLSSFLEDHPLWEVEIIGKGAEALRDHKSIRTVTGNAIHLTETLSRSDLQLKYLQSRIIFCGSRYESFHISSAEALCCGCSVVTADHPLLASTRWFTTIKSGQLARDRSAEALGQALSDEASAWTDGTRNPNQISATWKPLVSGSSIARSIADIVMLKSGRS